MKNRVFRIVLLLSVVLWYGTPTDVSAQSYDYETLSQKAVDAASKEDYETALIYNERAIKADPTQPDAYYCSGLLYMHVLDNKKACDSFIKFLEYAPEDEQESRLKANVYLGEIYYAWKNYPKALEHINAAISIDEMTELLFSRGLIHYRMENLVLAYEDFSQFKKMSPDNASADYMLALIEHQYLNLSAALSHYNDFISKEPEDERGYEGRAKIYMFQDKFDEAAADIITALRLAHSQYAYDLMVEIVKYAFVPMRTKIEAEVLANPNNAQWVRYLGMLNEEAGNFQVAIECYKQAQSLEEIPIIYMRIANCYNALNDVATSIDYVDKAIELEPDCLDYWELKLFLYNSTGKYDETLNVIDKMIELDPDNSFLIAERGYIKEILQDYEGALNDYTTSLLLSPDDNFTLILSRARVYSTIGQGDIAKNDLNKVLSTDTSTEPSSFKIFALAFLGRHEEAIEWMDKMLKTADKYDYYNIACAYSIMGDLDKSLSCLEESIKLGYSEYYHMKSDPYLHNIRQVAAFDMLLKKYFKDKKK